MKKIEVVFIVSDDLYNAEFKEDAETLVEEIVSEMLDDYPGEHLEMTLSITDI